MQDHRTWNYKYYRQAIFTYIITVGAVVAAKTSGFWWFNETNEINTITQKRTFLQTNQTQTLPLVECVEIGRFSLVSDIQDIVIRNNISYLATGEAGLQVFDVTDSANPIFLDRYQINGFLHQIKIFGNDLYLAYDLAGLRIVDVTNPNNLSLLGVYMHQGSNYFGKPIDGVAVASGQALLIDSTTHTFILANVSSPTNLFSVFSPTADSAEAISIIDNIAYVSATRAGVYIINVTDPNNPQQMGIYHTPYWASDAVAVDSLLYVADGSYGLQVVNVSDLTNPLQIGNVSNNWAWAYAIKVVGSLVFLIDDTIGLEIFDAKNATNPQLIGSFNTSTEAQELFMMDDLAYIANGNSGLQIINVTNLASPQWIGNFSNVGWAYDLMIVKDRAYVVSSKGLFIINISNPFNPQLLGNLINDKENSGICIVNDLAYLATWDSGLQIISVVDATNPTFLKNYSTPGIVHKVQVINDIAYVADGDWGLQIINTSRLPQNPVFVFQESNTDIKLFSIQEHFLYIIPNRGLTLIDPNSFINSHYFLLKGVKDVAVVGSIAVVRSATLGLKVIDLNNLDNLNEISSLSTTTSQSQPGIKINLNNNLLYTLDMYFIGHTGVGGLNIIDMRNASNPQLLGNFSLLEIGYGYCIKVKGDLAYIGGANFALSIFNISDPSKPQNISFLYNGYITSYAIDIVDNTVYLGGRGYTGSGTIEVGRIIVIDINNITNPQLIQRIDLESSLSSGTIIYGMNIVEPLAFIGASDSGLWIYEISDSYNFQKLAKFNTFGTVFEVRVIDNIAYIANGNSGLQLVDITDLTFPQFFQNYDIKGNTQSIAFSDNLIFIADSINGLHILNLTFNKNNFQPSPSLSQATFYNAILYLADIDKNLYIINITDITNPREITRYTLGNQALAMFADANYLYIAEGLFLVEIVDVSNITQPIFAGRITQGLTNAKSVTAEGNRLYVIDNYKEIVVFEINSLFYLSGKMVIYESESHSIVSSDVTAINFPSGMFITVLNISHGQFELRSQPFLAISNFNLTTVQNNQVIFIHDGGKFAPSFDLLISDGTITKGPFRANILFYTINHPPVLGNHFIQINEAQSTILNSTHFNATDDETSLNQIEFVMTQQGHSQFERSSESGIVITRFTQQDLKSGTILFRHVSETTDSDLMPFCFVTAVDDQNLESNPVPIQFDYNAAPKFIHNQLAISRGETVVVTSNELQATDRDDPAYGLLFIISNSTHGNFNKANFTQAEIGQGIIRFTHDGSEQAPSFEVSLQDKRMQTANQTVTVTFSNKKPNLAFDELGIGLTGAGAGVGLALVGIGIFAYRKVARNLQSRKSNPFAAIVYQAIQLEGASNFNTSKGQRFVQGIQDLKSELSKQGIDVDRMGNWELNQLAEQTTMAIQQEISTDTNWRGESIVDGHDIQRYATKLAIAIQQIRAGVYESTIYSM